MMTSQRCTAHKQDGTPCRVWAVRGTDPPRCAVHGESPYPTAPLDGKHAQAGGARGKSTQPAGAADLDAVTADLLRRLEQLSEYVDEHITELGAGDLVKLLSLQGQLASRLSRLMKDRAALVGQVDERTTAIYNALDDLSRRWGVDL